LFRSEMRQALEVYGDCHGICENWPPSSCSEGLGCTCAMDIKMIAAALAVARRNALEEAAKLADWSNAHSECGHAEGYRDGRTDAALAIRAAITSSTAA